VARHGGLSWWRGMVAWNGGVGWWHGMVAWDGTEVVSRCILQVSGQGSANLSLTTETQGL